LPSFVALLRRGAIASIRHSQFNVVDMSQRYSLSLLCCVIACCGMVALNAPDALFAAERAAHASPSRTYILGPNDRIRVKVYGEQDITGEYEIDSAGNVSIPLAGHVKAAGLTTRQVERAIAAALSKGIVRDPRVNVEVAAYRPYYILGEVKKSGEYPYRNGLTVLDAVASAGGFTYRANEDKVYLRRSGSTTEEVYPLTAPVLVYPGDNIRIPERYF
jgi:polysaccharide export outer membrane protein